MSEPSGPESPWRTAKLVSLMFAVFLGSLAIAALVTYRIIFPMLGVDPNDGVLLTEEPVKAGLLIASVLFAAIVVCYGSAILGSWIAKRFFPLNEVESEFLRMLWLPGTRTVNSRLFRYLFSRRADV